MLRLGVTTKEYNMTCKRKIYVGIKHMKLLKLHLS
jgi:hypothetical protein